MFLQVIFIQIAYENAAGTENVWAYFYIIK